MAWTVIWNLVDVCSAKSGGVTLSCSGKNGEGFSRASMNILSGPAAERVCVVGNGVNAASNYRTDSWVANLSSKRVDRAPEGRDPLPLVRSGMSLYLAARVDVRLAQARVRLGP